MVAAGLADTVATTKNITVFAPTNAAFAYWARYDQSAIVCKQTVIAICVNLSCAASHSDGKDVKPGMVKTLQGQNVMVTSNGKLQDANGRVANIVTTDIKASNGVVHGIDRVICQKDKLS